MKHSRIIDITLLHSSVHSNLKYLFPTMKRSFLYVLLYRLSHYYYHDYYYYRLTGRFYRISYSYFEKHAQRSKKNLNNISLSSNLRVSITC